MKTHLAVVGAGPGGFEAALEAAARGLETTLIHHGPLGGTCLNAGCIPTKFWLGATDAVEELAAQAGVRVLSGTIEPDFAAMQARKNLIIEAVRKAMASRLDKAGVAVVQGKATLEGPGRVLLDGGRDEVEYDQLILATGSRPSFPPFLAPDGERILDSTALLELDAAPSRLIVVGAGYIGVELAQAMDRFGADIVLVDALDRIASAEDPEVSKLLLSLFKRRKWDIRLGARVQSLATREHRAVLTLDGGETLEADYALAAVGRGPCSVGLHLAGVGAATDDRGFIATDQRLRAAENVYAVGDVNGRFMLAHAAAHQGVYVAKLLAGALDRDYEPGPIPSILYGSPEVVRVGRMESEMDAGAGNVRVSRAQMAANPLAQAHASTRGFVKVVWENGHVAGVTAVGHQASRLATAATIMVGQSWTRDQAADLIFAHPTLDESLKEALLA